MAFVFEKQPDHRLTAEQLAVYTATSTRRMPILRVTRDDLSAVHDPHIEATDGWAIGYYRGTYSAAEYTALLTARWHEIIDSRGMQP